MKRDNRRRKGFVLVLFTLAATVLLPMAGLAVDVILLYVVKTRLSASIDAAALAGARSLNRGLTLAAQEASAIATAQQYYRANFPQGYMMTETPSPNATVTVAEPVARTRTVTIEGEVRAPLLFMRWFGSTGTMVRARGTALRRDVNIALVLDRSGSMAGTPCAQVKNAANIFVENFAEGRDNVGLVTYSSAASVDFQAQPYFKTGIANAINAFSCDGWTGTAQGLWLGYQDLVRLNQPGALNVIILFTDGKPNTLTFTGLKVRTVAANGYPKSPCTNVADKTGLIYPQSTSNDSLGASGLYRWLSTGNPTMIPSSQRTNCAMNASAGNVEQDIAYLPETDMYGNQLSNGYVTAYLNRWSGGPYANGIRLDDARTLETVATNAVDSAGYRIRQNLDLFPAIFTIGYGTGVGAQEDDLLTRVANDPNSSVHDPTKYVGKYFKAPTDPEIYDAFMQIASEILRLTM